jgi:CheY-like chemotaxis protein
MNPTILIAVSNRREAHRTAERCREMGLQVELAYDGLTALTAFLFAQPDMVCIDARLLSSDGEPTFDVFARDALRTSTPVIVMKDPNDDTRRWSDQRTQFIDWDWSAELADCLQPVIAKYFGISLTELNELQPA